MQKKSILNLIRYHMESNDAGFRAEASSIASEFDLAGDHQLAEYIMSLLSSANSLVPQMRNPNSSEYRFFERVAPGDDPLLLPDDVTKTLLGIVNAVRRNLGVNKFLFSGAPGTGKTEAAKHMARLLNRDIFLINTSEMIDSKLGQTQRNLVSVFRDIESLFRPDNTIILFDEIDSIALDRTDGNDVREMGRVVSTLLREFDLLGDEPVILATTNLMDRFDDALLRRFDYIVSFDKYGKDDIIKIAEVVLDGYLSRVKLANRDIRLVKKIIGLYEEMPSPGVLKNIIKTSVAFSDLDDGKDYFRRLYKAVTNVEPGEFGLLKKQGFTIREIEILTKQSKSSIQRELATQA